MNFLFIFVRRLCPDINFFQKGSEYPCRTVVDEVGLERLHQRVTNKTLTSASVTKRGIGLKKVSYVIVYYSLFFVF